MQKPFWCYEQSTSAINLWLIRRSIRQASLSSMKMVIWQMLPVGQKQWPSIWQVWMDLSLIRTNGG